MPSYEMDLPKFEGYNTQVLGISVDHVPCLKAWAESLGGIHYPLLSDFWPHGQVAQRYGVFREEGYAERALFVVDKQGIIRYAHIHAIDYQPDNEEVFHVLRQLEPGAVVPDTAPVPAQSQPTPIPTRAKPRSVMLYCRPGCIDCRLARRFLEQHDIPFVEVNIRAAPDAEAKVREWTGGPLISPIFDIEGTIVIDFNPEELKKALALT